MSAKKLGRLAGFVFVLAAVFGSPAAASASVEHKAEVQAVSAGPSVSTAPVFQRLIDVIWT